MFSKERVVDVIVQFIIQRVQFQPFECPLQFIQLASVQFFCAFQFVQCASIEFFLPPFQFIIASVCADPSAGCAQGRLLSVRVR